jgi:hypothetical protein
VKQKTSDNNPQDSPAPVVPGSLDSCHHRSSGSNVGTWKNVYKETCIITVLSEVLGCSRENIISAGCVWIKLGNAQFDVFYSGERAE